MTGNKKREILILLAGLMLSIALTPSLTYAQDTSPEKEVWKTERVYWNGFGIISPEGKVILKITGDWVPTPERFATLLGLGYFSPYFRLNDDNQTIFRGLGREDTFAQIFFPSWRSRKKLRDILSVDEEARESLKKFDKVLGTGAAVYTGGSILSLGGTIAMIFGAPGLFSDDTSLFLAGFIVWIIGESGEIIGRVMQREAFEYLDEAIDHFNATQTKISSNPSNLQVSFMVKVEDGKLIPTIGFTF